MSFWLRLGMLGVVLWSLLGATSCIAQTLPLLGYVAAKDVNPKGRKFSSRD